MTGNLGSKAYYMSNDYDDENDDFQQNETVSVDIVDITISVSITIVFHEQTIHNIVGCDDPTRRKCLRVNECVNTKST